MMPRPYLWSILALTAASFGLGAAFYPSLPETVPIHWNIHGQADGWGPRWVLAFLLPTVNLAVVGLFVALPVLGPFRANFERFRVTYARICLIVVATFVALDVLFLLAGMGQPVRVGPSIAILLGVMLALIGNWMGKIRRNFYVGIRTPWTLANEVVWERTHRVGGWVMAAAGMLTALGGVAAIGLDLPDAVCFVLTMGLILGAAAWTVIYSYVVYRRVGQVDDLAA